jgi:hypothetical protein
LEIRGHDSVRLKTVLNQDQPMKSLTLPLGAAVLSLVSFSATAATLTSVPMQGGMVMPMVAYQAVDGRIHVMMPPDVPQLTPLLVSNPADNFDPGDPWFDSLDPSRAGASFSRRYGFVMDAMSDPLPPNTQMWIRKLSGSPGLKAYRYKETAPKAWDPIYDTDGVTNALYWNGMMFHPAFTSPPGTNNLTATFEVFLLDTTTGLEVANSSSDPLVFNWKNVSDGRPALTLEQRILVNWPSGTATNWVLESASSPNATVWNAVTNAPVTVDGQPGVVLEGSAAQEYYRMHYVP